MSRDDYDSTSLTRRERQIMDVIFRRGQATAAQVREEIPEAPSYSAVRALLRLLEEKGHLQHGQDGPRYVYRATAMREDAARSAARRLLDTFFDGSVGNAVSTLFDVGDDLSREDLERLASLVERARKDER